MARIVQAACARCGFIKVSIRDVVADADKSEIRLNCPVCRGAIAVRVGAEVLQQILDSGAKQPEPITDDDLIDFHKNFDEEMRRLMT